MDKDLQYGTIGRVTTWWPMRCRSEGGGNLMGETFVRSARIGWITGRTSAGRRRKWLSGAHRATRNRSCTGCGLSSRSQRRNLRVDSNRAGRHINLCRRRSRPPKLVSFLRNLRQRLGIPKPYRIAALQKVRCHNQVDDCFKALD